MRSVEDETARIAVIGDTGYISTRDGIQPINQDGLLPLVAPVEPTFGPLIGTNRVVADSNGELFFGAKFDRRDFFFGRRGGLYSLEDPSTPARTWPGISSFVGFDSSLRGYTGIHVLMPDGSIISPIPFMSDDISQFFAGDVTPKGTVLGGGVIPGTIGEGPALLYTDGSAELLSFFGSGDSIRDRLDGDGVNVGYVADLPVVRYGSSPEIVLVRPMLQCCSFDIIVSESDFTAVSFGRGAKDQFVYYPGVNPAGDDLTVPLLDVFPALQSLDFDEVIDASSAGGQIHLLLSGDDGLWLFAAPDSTVVPESATATLSGMLIGILMLRWRQFGA